MLKLFKEYYPGKIPPIHSNRLGAGFDGEVYQLLEDYNKVVKFSVVYDCHYGNYANLDKVLSYLTMNNAQAYAHVYERKYLGEYSYMSRDAQERKCLLHYYIMEKLNKISEDEYKVFYSIISHEDRNIVKNYSIEKIRDILKGLSKGLDFDEKKIIFFYESLIDGPIIHNDLHPRNVMKDGSGHFKLIDFDRCILKDMLLK